VIERGNEPSRYLERAVSRGPAGDQGHGEGDRPSGPANDWLALPPSAAYGALILLSWPLIFWGIGRYGVAGKEETRCSSRHAA